MRRFQVSIQRSELLTIADSVGEWEIPILQLVHGAEAVAIGGSTKDPANYPAPAVEYERLERRYGENPATGAKRVAEVYGPAPGGIRILMQAIKDAATEQNTPESMGGPDAQLSDELNAEIVPQSEVDQEIDLGDLTGDATDEAPAPAPAPAPKPAAKPAAPKKAPTGGKQLIAKTPAKAPIVPTPAQPTDPLKAADPLAIDE